MRSLVALRAHRQFIMVHIIYTEFEKHETIIPTIKVRNELQINNELEKFYFLYLRI